MARITVEDCLQNVRNRFHLVLLSSKRARQLENTIAQPLVAIENDKPTVIALREIAEGLVSDDNIDEFTKPPVEKEEQHDGGETGGQSTIVI